MELNFAQHEPCKTVYMQVGTEDVECLDNSMKAVVPNTKDAAVEKHVPAVEFRDGKTFVQIGSVEHPMIPEHYIEWILVQTKDGMMMHNLQAGVAPRAEFPVAQADVVAVYEYCNIHGLWVWRP